VCDRCPVRSDCYEWYLDRPVDLRKNVIAGGEFFNNHGQPQPVTGRISRLGPDGLLSAHAAAALVLCSRRAIVDACHTGELASQRTSGGQWRIRPVDLYEWAGLEGP
jgi:hypothetical protein